MTIPTQPVHCQVAGFASLPPVPSWKRAMTMDEKPCTVAIGSSDIQYVRLTWKYFLQMIPTLIHYSDIVSDNCFFIIARLYMRISKRKGWGKEKTLDHQSGVAARGNSVCRSLTNWLHGKSNSCTRGEQEAKTRQSWLRQQPHPWEGRLRSWETKKSRTQRKDGEQLEKLAKKRKAFQSSSYHLEVYIIYIYSDILSGTLSGIYYGILSGIYSDTLSDMGTAIPQPRAPDLSRSTDKIQGPSAGRWETLQRFESLLSQHLWSTRG